MKVAVKLFAAARQAAERESIELDVAEPATVASVRQAIEVQYPGVHRVARNSLFAVDGQYADDAASVSSASEIACIPPVSGG